MTFAELGVDERILRALTEMGITQPSEVQAGTIPLIRAGVGG